MLSGLFVPSDLDVEKCESGKGCDYGICDECKINNNNIESEYNYDNARGKENAERRM